MDHEVAVKTMAVERYCLGELSAAERDEFEEHYFGCPACAEDLKLHGSFEANLRAVFGEEAPAREAPAWSWRDRIRGWFTLPVLAPVSVAAALAVAVAYQQWVVIPGLERAAAPSAALTWVLGGSTRGETPVVTLKSGEKVLALTLEVNAPPAATRLRFQLRDSTGTVLWETAGPGGPTVLLRLPAARLASGRYEVVLLAASDIIERYRFELRRD